MMFHSFEEIRSTYIDLIVRIVTDPEDTLKLRYELSVDLDN